MKTIVSSFLLPFTIAGFLLLSGNSLAQQESGNQAKGKNTISIRVTKEVDGNTVVIDTTVVTDGDFDADAYLQEKGIGGATPEAGRNVEKQVIIRHPGSYEFKWNDSDCKLPDTIIIKEDKSLLFDDKFDMSFPPRSGMPFNFKMPHAFPYFDSKQVEAIFEGMARSIGLENVTPFGEMKQVVVKRKRNGKKVIITFEDRKGKGDKQEQGNKKEEKVIILQNGEQGMAPQNEERVIINGQPGEDMVIHKNVKKTESGDQAIINVKVDKPTEVKTATRVIIIKNEGTK